MRILQLNGKDILAIHVPRAQREDKPVFVNDDMMNGTFRRNGEGDYHCTKAEVKAMLRDQTEETADMKVLEDMDISDLNAETVHAYRNRHAAYRNDHVWEGLTDETYLERIGAVKRAKGDGKLHPTAAGLLMFGEEYRILYEYPEYFLDYREMLDPTIRWTDRLQSSSGDWTGNLFDFFFRVNSKLAKDLKIPFKLEGITRIDDTPVHKALREALANCLVNTDFFVPRGVVIRKDASSITIENPGYIRTGKDQMLKGGISDPRNKALMKMFNMIGIGERSGHLEKVMRGLEKYYAREDRIRSSVVSAVTYPMVLSVMLVLIVFILLWKVLPVFRRVLNSMGVGMSETGSAMRVVFNVFSDRSLELYKRKLHA